MSLQSGNDVWRSESGEPDTPSSLEALRRIVGDLDEALANPVARRAESGRYQIEDELGHGGMGVVLRAWDPRLRRTVAMKVVRGDARRDPQRMRRFLREARVTGQLQHPGIVPVHELGVNERGEHFFTMPVVSGERLDRVFAAVHGGRRGASLTRALDVLVRVAETLAFAHERGVIHRDIKPENVMVGRFGETYLMDWGLAKVLSGPEGGDPPDDDEEEEDGSQPFDLGDSADLHTRVGGVMGSPSYAAPEQAAGRLAEVGPLADVYSLGAMLYTLLASAPPYPESPSSSSSFEAVCKAPPTPIHELAPAAPPELLAICERAMARRPEDRYASMAELAEDLRAFREGRVVRAHRVGALVELRKWVARNRGVAAWMSATLLVALAGVSTLLWLEARRRREEFLAADVMRLPYLLGEADELWPAEPGRVPDLEQWLVAAGELAGRVELHRARAAALTARLAGRAPDSEARGRSALVEGLAGLVATIADVERRLHFARGVRWWSLEEPSARRRWQEAVDSIAVSPAYGGLRIVPQLGLLPIGRDPASGLWEFAHLETGAEARRLANGLLDVSEESGIVFVLVPGGTFMMGESPSEVSSFDWEWPEHPVTLGPFFLSKFEMTQAQWLRSTGTNPSVYSDAVLSGDGPPGLHPVEFVSWTESDIVLRRMSLSLPTEAQWEYAARGGTDAQFWSGDSHHSLQDLCAANLYDMSAFLGFQEQRTVVAQAVDWLDDGFVLHAPVGTFAPNPFGLHDVLGNVWEWCQDWLTPYYVPPRPGDGLRSEPGPGKQRVERGGSFRTTYTALRSSFRENLSPDMREAYVGLRPARALLDAPAERD